MEQQVLQAQLMSLRPLPHEEMEFADFVRILEQEGPPAAPQTQEPDMHDKDVVVIPSAPAPPPQVIDLSPLGSHVASVSVGEDESADSDVLVLDEVPEGFPDRPPRVAQ
ncbi:hypothetical protein R1sor_003374 [Riccia sorocarpa]|uniref:Uncharacterized protein n=1 Tax=Riccia sorocarpa TaxID=122646 RepID=A0ABD3H1E9_9MARC